MHFMARRQWRAIRIGDAERERAVTALKRHYQDGRLSFEEFDERAHQAFGAKTNGDLERIHRDLPVLYTPAHADRQVRIYLVVNALIVLLWSATDANGPFWPIFPIVIWGLLLAARGHRRQQRSLPRARP